MLLARLRYDQKGDLGQSANESRGEILEHKWLGAMLSLRDGEKLIKESR